ncbi:MAG: hypothetical protein JNJ57_13255, partial [Saprospiraceae bacterium]|nr:hypothetical protein [Saprospiraceae bacterium]
MKAQTLFDFTNNSGGVPNYTDPNLGFDNLKRGSGVGTANLTCTGLSDGYGATGWPTTNTFNTATFNTAGEYFEVKIWPQYDAMNMIDYGLNVTGFTARLRRENYNGTVSDGPIGVRYALRNSGGGGWTSGFNPGNPQQSIVCSSSGTLRPWTGFPAQLVDPGDTLYIRIYGLSSGANETGDFVLKNVVVQGFACAAPPTISPEPDFFAVCAGETEVGFEYSAATGNTYTISYEDDPDALLAGFTSQSGDLDEEGGTITLNIPEEAPSGYYYGTMIVENDCGFTTEYPFTVYVKPLPDVSISVMPLEICAMESVTLTFTDNAASGNFFSILADLNDERGLLPDEVNYTG